MQQVKMKDTKRKGKKSGRPGPSKVKSRGIKSRDKSESSGLKQYLRCRICDRNLRLCGCQEQMKSSLEKIFNSKFNQIFLEFGFNLGVKLKSLQEQLIESQNHSVFDIAKEADEVYSMFATIFSAEETNGEFIQKVYGTEFTPQELNDVARSLQTRTSTLLGEFKRKDTSNNNNSSDESISFSPQQMELEEFPLAAPEEGKFHDFDCPGINHYYVATSQYFKNLLRQTQRHFPMGWKPIENKADSVQSVEHISNPKTLEKYEVKKLEFKEAGKVNAEKKVREMLLFHGTDAANIDSILKDGFNLDFIPTHKMKLQLYGRGIYMAENPELAFQYGNIILICKVSILTSLYH